MQHLELHINRIQAKLQDLLKKQATLEKEAAQHLQTISTLKQQQELHEKKIKTLEEQQYILKSAAGNMNETDKKAFEQTISKYIREIDKCIALLSE